MVCKKSVTSLIEPPTAAQLEIILKDTNEIDQDKLKHNERLIQEWIICQDHFPKNIDKRFIRGMLRHTKHNLERTKQKLEYHLAARHIYPEIYANRSPFEKGIAQAMDGVNMALIPRLTPKGYRIWIFGLNRRDPSEFSFQNCFKLFFMIYEMLMCLDAYCTGEIAIFDASNFSAAHFAAFFGPFLKTLIVLSKEAYAIRLKEMHVINAPTVMNKMVATIKPILHAKVKNSIYISDSPKLIIDSFGLDHLPSNYGGNLKSLRELATDWYDAVSENLDWFEAQETVKIVGVPKKVHSKLCFDGHLGLDGSFRKLEID